MNEKTTVKRNPVDPLVRAMRRVYRTTPQFPLDELLKEQSRWSRRVTIASNKLEEVRYKIDQLAGEYAQILGAFESTPEGKKIKQLISMQDKIDAMEGADNES